MSGRHVPDWRTVAAREMRVKLTDKNFILSTVFTIAALIFGFAVQGVIMDRVEDVKVGIIAGQGGAREIVEGAERTANDQGQQVTLDVTEYPDAAAAESAVRGDDGPVAVLEQQGQGWRLVGGQSKDGQLERYVSAVVADQAIARNAQAAGTSMEALSANAAVPYDLLEPDSDELDGMMKFFVGLGLAMLFYMASLLFGMAIAQSVVEEKQSRIVEILAAAVPTRHLLIGKVVGNTVLALGQMALMVGTALIGLQLTEYKHLLPQMSGVAAWFLLFFVVGFVAIACLWAVAGALCSRHEDLQSTSTPLTMVLILVFMGSMGLEGSMLKIASFIPVVSSIAMPMRLLGDGVHWWEPVVAMLLTLVAAAGIIVVAEKMYRRAVMQSGRVGWKEALRAR